jgi:thiol:disulfide interchange protein DsbD
MAQRILTLILLLCSTTAAAGLFDAPGRSTFVPADQAFTFDFQQHQQQLNLIWQVKDGYYLYRKQIRITPAHAAIAEVQLPAGEPHEDEFYGKSEIYRGRLSVPVTVSQAAAGATLTVTYQGCADAGFCYPPESKTVPLSAVVAGEAAQAAATPDAAPSQETSRPAPALPFSALWALLIGIGIAFTPCVLPMYPLISGIVLGGRQRLSTGRALLLAFIYVQGMALTYTALGLVVAAAGMQFQAALQHPYVLIGLAAAFTLLALSMFGLFTLQLPSALQTRLTLISNRQQGGSSGGVFAMGAIAGLICSPCTTAPLSAILLYIAQSGKSVAGRRYALSLCAGHGPAADSGGRLRQPPAAEKRPVDGAR